MAEAIKVLCVDDDRDIAEILQAVLTDEGYAVSCLYDAADDAVLRAAGRLEPDTVLLDGGGPAHFGASWKIAASLADRPRPIPVVMFSAHHRDLVEAREGTSERAVDARFAAVISKPFKLDDLLEAIAKSTARSTPFDQSQSAEERRTDELVQALKARGATNIQPSTRREWAMFSDRGGNLVQLYWWQARGVYQVGRYEADGDMKMIGQFLDRDTAIELVLPSES